MKTWLMVGAALIVATTLVVLTAVGQWYTKRSLDETSETLLTKSEDALIIEVAGAHEAIARELGKAFELKFEEVRRILFTLSLSPDIRHNDDAPAAVAFMQTILYQEPLLLSLSLVDAVGQERIRLVRDKVIDPTELRQLTGSAAYISARLGQSYLSPLLTDLQTDGPFIELAEPVEKFPGEVTGVLIADVDLSEIWDLAGLAELSPDSPGYIYVVDAGHGLLVAHPERQRTFTGTDPINLDLSGRLQGRTVSELLTINGEAFLVSSAHNTALNWLVVAVEPAEFALAPIASQSATLSGDFNALEGNLLILALIVAALLLAGTMAVVIVGARAIVAPIQRLVDGTAAVADGDLDYRIEPQGYREVDLLARDFNRMVTALGASYDALQSEISERARFEIALERSIDELTESQAQLIQAEKMSALGTLVAGVAHELNNPMMGILNFAQFCARKTSEDDERYEVLKDIEVETKRCSAIVESLLTFSRSEHLKEESMQPGDCTYILKRALALLSYRFDSHSVSVTENFDEETPSILGRVNQIEQVFLNLITNAIHALRSSKRQEKIINVSVRPEGDFVQVTVEDNGPGIDPEALRRIFDPFFTTKPTGEGTGLGLSVSRNIIEAHGGEINCESDMGFGTRFRILLPIHKEQT